MAGSWTTGLGYGYSAVKHGTLYAMGSENQRDAASGFFIDGAFNNVNLSIYNHTLGAVAPKLEQLAASQGAKTTFGQVARTTFLQAKPVLAAGGAYVTQDAAGKVYNSSPLGIPIRPLGLRPQWNPYHPLDPNNTFDSRLIEENMSHYNLPNLDAPRGDLDQ